MDGARVLVVEDEKRMGEFLETILAQEGYRVDVAGGGEEAVKMIGERSYDLIITDLMMPKVSGMRVLEVAKEDDPDSVVIMITGYSTVETAIEAMKKGAYHYIPKPFKIDEIKLVVRNGLEQRRIVVENRKLREELKVTRVMFGQIIGQSKAMREVYDLVQKVAATDSTVLIRGESGTGKELVARALQRQSARADKAFVAVNCAALPETLLESELFGHARGAFTGAVQPRKGLFEEADGGTIFLDEIGDISRALQAKLLRVLEEGEFMRVGESKGRKVDVRIIAATNRDLEAAIAEGKFRPELFYRLNVITINLPPLREREGDVPLLAMHFLKKYAQKVGKKITGFSPAAMGMLNTYSWPGNVRELENVIERAVILSRGPFLDGGDLPRELAGQGRRDAVGPIRHFPSGFNFKEHIAAYQRELILRALEEAQGVQARAAAILGMKRTTLHEMMKRLDMQEGANEGSQGFESPSNS